MSGESKTPMGIAFDIVKSIAKSFIPAGSEKLFGDRVPEPEEIYGDYTTGLQPECTVPIVVDKTVRTKYKAGWINRKRTKPIIEVVIHGTAGGDTTAGLLHWMYNDGRPGYYDGIGLFHYAIGRGSKDEIPGLIVEIIDPEYYVYHSTSSRNDFTSIGIELLNSSNGNRNPYTDEQYASLFSLIFDHIIKLYPVTRIVSHKYNIWRWNSKATAQKNDKNCPGNFDWARLDAELKRRNYSFKIDGDLRYEIDKQQKVAIKKV